MSAAKERYTNMRLADASEGIACVASDDMMVVTSDHQVVGEGKRPRVEEPLPRPGDQELSGIECPWCGHGKLFIWKKDVMLSRGTGRPFLSNDISGPVVCSHGRSCAASSRREELQKNLHTFGGQVTIEHIHWKVCFAVHDHLSRCQPLPTPHRVGNDDDASCLYRRTMQMRVVARRIGDPAHAMQQNEDLDCLPPMLFYFLRCALCDTESFIA